jgi:hypothetical protein
MYSGYQGTDTKERYNVDWSLCAPHLDLVMAGYGRRIDEVVATKKAAGKTPCVFGCITSPYDFQDDKLATTITTAEVLRRLCDARGGVLYYDLSNGDARTLQAFAKVSRVAAEFADFFVKGAEASSAFKVIAGDIGSIYAFAFDGRSLLCLVNETGSPTHFEIECPGDVSNFFSKGPRENSRLHTDVPAGEIAVYVVER